MIPNDQDTPVCSLKKVKQENNDLFETENNECKPVYTHNYSLIDGLLISIFVFFRMFY
jgi:hypothetical protein